MNEMNASDLKIELARLEESYYLVISQIHSDTGAYAASRPASSHLAHNLHSKVNELAVLAGKIEQTQNVIRWMATPAESLREKAGR
jgi:hypothetical protein